MRRGDLDSSSRGGDPPGSDPPGTDFDVQMTLELARDAREPSLADKQRVFEALQVRLGDVPSFPSAGESTTGVRLVVPRVPPVSIATRVTRSLISSKAVLHFVWVGAATGGLGFWLGASSGDPSPVAEPPARAVVASSSVSAPRASALEAPATPALAAPPSVAPSSIDSSSTQPSPTQPSPTQPSPPKAALVQPAPTPPERMLATEPALPRPPAPPKSAEAPAPVAAPARAPRASAPARPRQAPGGASVRAAAPPGLDRDARFLEAVRLLSRAERALDAGEPALALVLLDEIEERAPRELLREERDAARVVASCKTGDLERARRLAAELADRSPGSIYAARIARSCPLVDPGASDRARGSDRSDF